MTSRIGRAICLLVLNAQFALADPPRVVSVEPAADLDALFARTEGWIGADGNYSVTLGPDRTLWFFSDTWLGTIVDGKRTKPTMINNSIGVQTKQDTRTPIEYYWDKSKEGKPAALIRPQDGKGWYWPLGGVSVDGQVHVSLHQIDRTGAGGAFGFKSIGVWHGTIENPLDTPPQWRVRQRPLPFIELSDQRHLLFGAAMMKHEGFVYIFGTDEAPKEKARIRHMVVARVKEKEIAEFDQWRFWDGAGWQADCRKSAGVLPGIGSEFSVVWVPGQKRFVNVTHDIWLSPSIVARTAEQPWGPWSKPVKLFTCPEGKRPGVFTYSGKAHAGLSTGSELVITYAANAHKLADVINDATLYWPRFVRVRLEL